MAGRFPSLTTAGDITKTTTGGVDTIRNVLAPAQSFFMLPIPFSSSIGSLGPAANTVYFFRFRLPFRISVSTVHFRVNAANVAGLAAVGIYSNDGLTKLVDTGAVAATSIGVKSVTLGAAVELSPGFYLAACTVNLGTVDLASVNDPTNWDAIMNAVGVPAMGTCANASAAGVLPATTGALTAVDIGAAVIKFAGA